MKGARRPANRPEPSRRALLGWAAGAAGVSLSGCRASDGRPGPVHRADWRRLRTELRGELVTRGEPTYEGVRSGMVWNAAKPSRYPQGIVRVGDEADVRATLRFARRHSLRVAVRGGGHHFDGVVLREGGILLDLSGLTAIRVDPGARTAVVQPGVRGSELIDALAPHGLAFPVGHCASVPLSGFLLSGGFGWNSGSWGPAAASVRAVDLVTAEGECLRADETAHPELFWAVRGAGHGCPAVVVGFHLDLHARPRVIRTSTLTFAVDDLLAAAAWLDAVQPQLPPQVELIGLVVSPPPEARAAGAPPRVLVVSATAFAQLEEEASAWLAPFERGPASPAPIDRAPRVDTPFQALFASISSAFPDDHHYTVDHAWLDGTAADALARTRSLLVSPPHPRDFLLLAYGPNLPPGAPSLPRMALSVPGRLYAGLYGVTPDPGQVPANRAWVDELAERLEPCRAGRYVGEARSGRAEECFSPAAWQRLARLEREHDPGNVLFDFELPPA